LDDVFDWMSFLPMICRSYGTSFSFKNEVNDVHLYLFVNLLILVSPDYRILVPEFGSMHLELIPMLVGFFTYKIATFVEAIEDAITVATRKT